MLSVPFFELFVKICAPICVYLWITNHIIFYHSITSISGSDNMQMSEPLIHLIK